MSIESNLVKNAHIKETLRNTFLKRQSQVCKTFKFKIMKSQLSKEQATQLKMYFVEAKWIYNYLLAQEDIFHFDYKNLKDITHLDKDKNVIPVTIQYIGSSVKQELLQRIYNEIKGLAKKKQNGGNAGKLKFKSQISSIGLKQYGTTHIIKGNNRIKVQGIKKPLKVRGLDQLNKYKNIDYANACLLNDGINYYISFTCYIDKEELKRPDNFKNEIIGIDLGCETTITLSTGEKINVIVEETERLKKLQAKLARQIKGSNNYKKTKYLIDKEYIHMSNRKDDIANKLVHRLFAENRLVVIQDDPLNEWHESDGQYDTKPITVQHSILGRLKSMIKRQPGAIILSRWYATSKKCTNCGHKLKELPLSERTFVCPKCGYTEDRDIHAAKNMIYFYQKYKSAVGMPDTSMPVTIEFLKELNEKFAAKQEDTTSLALY